MIHALGCGLIPALAGKTAWNRVDRRQARAHPRAGGENVGGAVLRHIGVGSSPRWRGKLQNLVILQVREGLIPALAGKTEGRAGRRVRLRAHPRAGGENTNPWTGEQARAGSSPRWRGKHQRFDEHAARRGLIPALAGKTPYDLRRQYHRAAHPRAGGENCYNTNGNRGVTGSSPRWRGKLLSPSLRFGGLGLIPALAGKTGERRSGR